MFSTFTFSVEHNVSTLSMHNLLQDFKNHPQEIHDEILKRLKPISSLREVKECGVKEYVLGRDANLCGGYEYLEKRSPYCGAETYRMIQDMRCAGSWVESKKVENGLEYPACKSSINNRADSPGMGASCNPRMTYKTITINHPANCRLAILENAETYKSCIDEHHEKIPKSCAHELFGVKSYNTCNIRYTHDELESFFKNLEQNLDTRAEMMLSYQSRIMGALTTPKTFACFIRLWENQLDLENSRKDFFDSLKLQFFKITGDLYEDYINLDCESLEEFDFNKIECPNEKAVQLCLYKARYNESLQFLEQAQNELALILVDKIYQDKGSDDVLEKILSFDATIASYLINEGKK